MSSTCVELALLRSIKPKYLLLLGLFFVGFGSIMVSLTSSFPVLLIGQMLRGLGFGFLDISLNTMATLAFQETLSEDLNTDRTSESHHWARLSEALLMRCLKTVRLMRYM